TDQRDADDDGIGDACDTQTCGDGVREAGEVCDGTDAVACPGKCQADCPCPCTTVTDRPVTVAIVTSGGAGKLTARFNVPLPDGYANQPVALRLDDTDSHPIVQQDVGALTPRGTSGRTWRYQKKGAGLQRVQLRALPSEPGL